MKNSFKKTLLILTLAGATALGGSMAMADQQGRHGKQISYEKKLEHFEKRQAKLKEALNLTSSQLVYWETFQKNMKPEEHTRPNPEEIAKLTAPERMDFMQTKMAQRLEHMKKKTAATKTFYAQLTTEQKATFDKKTLPRKLRKANNR